MKLTISRSAAWAAGFAAAAARVFYALAVEEGPIHNGVWLSALLGALGMTGAAKVFSTVKSICPSLRLYIFPTSTASFCSPARRHSRPDCHPRQAPDGTE